MDKSVYFAAVKCNEKQGRTASVNLLSLKFIKKRQQHKGNKSANEIKNDKPTQTSVRNYTRQIEPVAAKKGGWDSSQGHGEASLRDNVRNA